MKTKIISTVNWPVEKISPYLPEIVDAFQKVIERFPDDIKMENLVQNVLSGSNELWLFLDENDNFLAFLTVAFEVTVTGKKRVLLLNTGGKGGVDLAQNLSDLEDYARSIGADEICPYGRIGWKKAFENQGYKIQFIKFGKELNNG